MQVWEDHGKGVHYYMSEIKNSTGKNEVKAPKAPKEPKVQMWIEKHVVPVLKVIAANKFLRSLMEGFYAILPIIIFSSIDGIIMWVQTAFANNPTLYPVAVRQVLNTLYQFTMGFSGLWFTMAIAYQMADKPNPQ